MYQTESETRKDDDATPPTKTAPKRVLCDKPDPKWGWITHRDDGPSEGRNAHWPCE